MFKKFVMFNNKKGCNAKRRRFWNFKLDNFIKVLIFLVQGRDPAHAEGGTLKSGGCKIHKSKKTEDITTPDPI